MRRYVLDVYLARCCNRVVPWYDVQSVDGRGSDDDVADQDVSCGAAWLSMALVRPIDVNEVLMAERLHTKSTLAGAGFGTSTAAATALLSVGSIRRYSILTPVKLLSP